jgi:hypothetical protein
MRRRFVKDRDYDKIVVNIQTVGESTSYKASYEDLEFEGNTAGDESDIKGVLARMLTANKDIPDSLRTIVALVVGYVELMVNAGVWYVSTGYGYEFRWDCAVGAKVSVIYDFGEGGGDNNYVGWVVTVRAYFEGYDGLTSDARHDVKKTWRPGEKLDIDMLRTELFGLVRMAYNAFKGGPYRQPCQ